MSSSPSRRGRVFAVENRLAELAQRPGGRRVDEHVRAATQRVEAVRASSVAALAGKVDLLVAAAAAARKTPDAGDTYDGIYNLSNAIYGVASTFELKPLAQAAFSLCDLADGFRCGEPANWPAIDVHVDGIRLLVSLGEGAGVAGDEVLKGLRAVRDRVLGSGAG